MLLVLALPHIKSTDRWQLRYDSEHSRCRLAARTTNDCSMKPLIQLTDLVKDYRGTRALNGVNLSVYPGITGLLGPNGAGKSSLIKILLGLVRISAGTATVLGLQPHRHGRKIRNRIGYMPESDCYLPGLTGIEVVQFSAGLSGLPRLEGLRRSHEILDFCSMGQERYRNIETYSTGMRQKIKFAAAIVHDPELLILDEPTSGLDPEERESLLNRISHLHHHFGKSILLSTHILPDVQSTCDKVVIIADGRVLVDQDLGSLNRKTSPAMTVKGFGNRDAFVQTLAANGLSATMPNEATIVIESAMDASAGLAEAIWSAAEKSQYEIQELTSATHSLEDVFLQAVREASHAHS